MNHTEAIIRIVQTANQFQSSIVLKYDNKFIDVKSLLGIYTAILDSGEHELYIHGQDEDEAKSAMNAIFDEFSLRVKVVD